MASPFYLFRKYQKAFLVVAGVLAMFIFVVADPLMTWLQSSGGGGRRNANAVVATWDGGSLNLQQLGSLQHRRVKISQFLDGLIMQAARTIEQEGGSAQMPSLPDFRVKDYRPRSVQLGCINTRLLAEMAEKSGISVSDDVVNHYLGEWGLRRMGDAQIGELLGRVGLTDKSLFAGLRELLLGNFYINSYSLAMAGVMPEERWQDWKKMNERVAVEAALLPADKFLAAVPEPSEAQLKEFYELHKDRIDGIPQMVNNTRLPSPNPGFREPRRVKIQYLLASVDDWTLKLSDTVTDAEIADYYEQNKRTQFISTTPSTSAEGLFDDEEEDGEKEPNEEATEEATESDEAPADNESGLSSSKSPFRLAAFQEDAEAEAQDAEGETDADSETEVSETEAADTEAAPSELENDEPVKFVPLSDVSDQIRRVLAKGKAAVEIQKVVGKIFTRLESTYNPYGFKVVSARTEEREIPAPPALLADFTEMARESGLIVERTVLLTDREVFDTNVGKAVDAQTGRERVVSRLFGDLELFQPLLAKDDIPQRFESILGRDRSWYIVCKTEDVASRIPEFEKVRDKVLGAWKKQEAGKLALAKAQELTKQANESGDTVAVVARGAGYETITTDMFSWLTFGTSSQARPRLGDAPPLEAVDMEFMAAAFKLNPDQKIALLNHDHSSAYVIQLDRRELTKAEMRQQFLTEANSWQGARTMNTARFGNAQFQLVNQLLNQAGLDRDKLEVFFSEDSQ